jgi:hypothetical protein
MNSNRKILSSRANGALSRGPATVAGKHRSSVNATRHGLLSNTIVLANESREGFEALLCQYLDRFGPVDDVELGIIEEMVASFWRIRRAWAIETGLLDKGLDTQPPGDEIARIAATFWDTAATPQLGLLHRYETRLHRVFQRALQNLFLLRNLELPNEPSPISEHQRALPELAQ